MLVVSLPAWADYSLVYSETADRAGSMPLAEAVVVGDLYARLLPEDGSIEQVRFYLDGSGSVLKTERRAPYDLQGGSSSAANPFDTTDLADGAHTLRSLVDLRDGSQLSFETTFTVANDGPPNDAPQLASIGDQALLVGDSAALLISASDTNGDPLSFSSSALPAFASMSDNGDGTAILTLTPGVGDLGDHSITVNVSDGQLNDSETFIVSVSEPLGNLAPQLNPIGNQTLLVGESAVVAITASDLNGDPLSFTSSLLPAFASFIDNGNGTASLILAPGAADVGTHSLTVSVSDGELEASETFDIIVNEPPPNVTPVLGVIGNQNLQAGDSTTLLIVASDANGDPLSFSSSALPAFASFIDNGNGTASLILAPGAADVGTHSLTVSVSDGEFDDSESFDIIVSEAPASPYWLVYSETADRAGSILLGGAVVVGDLYARLLPEDGSIEQVRFYLDGSGSVLKTERKVPYDLQGGPSSAANPFDTTDLADGAHTLRSLVDLRDGSQLSFETTFTVANDGPPNDAPQLASIGDQALLVGDSAALLISASDANGDSLSFSSSALPAFASMSDNGDGTAILTLTPGVGDLGDHSITVNVSDGQLNDSETFIVSVSEPLDNLAPQLNPIGNQTLLVGASAVVAITASDLNGDPLSFTSSLLPAFASFIDNGNGTASLILAPGAADVGMLSLTVSVSDGELEASETFDIIVNEPPPNVAPVLGAIGNQNLQAGDSTTLLIVASDANGDPLSFSSSALPAFASFIDNGNGTASLILAPGAADVGTHSLTVSVSDGELDDSESFDIIVSEAPASPYWLVYSETADRAGSILLGGAVVVGDLYARLLPEDGSIEQVRFYLDGSGSVLKTERKVPYDLQGGPSSAANPFDTTDLADGAHTLRSLVDLRDGSQLSFETTFTVANDGPLNRAPVLNAIGAQSVQAGNMLELTLSASDPDGDLLTFSSDLLPGFAVLTDQGDGSASLSISPLLDDVGNYSVTIRVSDGELDDAESFALQVTALGSLPEVVEISEFMASNATTLADGDGDYEDWIELHNVGVDPVNLAGWCLTDDVAVWNTWCFPSVSLDADGYLLVFASKKTGSAVPEELHANLKLGKSGEYLGLYRPDASLAHAYSPNFPAQSDDISYGVSDAGQLRYFAIPTPGAANGVGLSDALSFDAASLSLSAQVGDATSVQVNLSSLQGGASGYALAVDDGGLGWLSAVAASGEDDLTPDLLDITANAAALAAGSYTATVTASAADHASAVLAVNFTVSEGGSVLETVEISEFMASNATTLVDGDGDYEDWIELHNTGASAVDLLNWCLTDDSADLFQWCFTESVSLAAGGHLVVFASGKSPAPAGQYHTLFKLSAGGEYLALVRPDGTIADEYAPAYPPQTTDVSYGIDDNGAEAFFLMPTPGEANGSGGSSGEPLSLSVERGFYDAPFQVTVSSDDSVELVRYTTDGSEPTLSNGLDYTGAVDITTTTVLRVAGFSSGVIVGRVQSHSYLFLEDVIRQPATVPGYPNNSYSLGQGAAVHDYEMDPDIVDDPNYSGSMIAAMRAVPSMSISIDPTDIFGGSGFYETEDIEKAVSLEILYADDPGASHQANAGIQSHSHNRLKRSLRLNFRALYGDAKFKSDLLNRAPLNGATADGKYDKLILRAGNNRSWARSWHPDETTYTVDQFYRDTQIAASGHGMRGTYVHLYINGLYWGLYNATERADKHFLSSYFGGADEHWFAANHGLVHDNAPPLSGDPTRYNYLTETLIYRDMSDPFNYAELQDYLEVDPFIDYLLVSWWSATNDWPDNNWYAGNRNETAPEDTTGLMYFAWDGEAAWDTPQDFGNPSGKAKIHPAFLSSEDVNSVGDAFVIARIWHAARQNADFMARFSTRVDELTGPGGVLDDTVARARWMTLTNFVREAVIGESARWGDAVDPNAPRTRDGAWQQEVDKIYDILGGNAAELRSQLAAEGFIP